MVGRMASRLALVTGPKIATTLSRWTSSRVRSTAVLGSVLSSAMTSSNRRPRTPPASLASSIASRVPCTPCWPRFSRPPESGCSTPTLIASAARAREGTRSPSAAVEAAPCNRRRRDVEHGLSVAQALRIDGPLSGCDAILERRAEQQRRRDVLTVCNDAEVRADVVERRLLLARPGRGHAVLGDDQLVAEEQDGAAGLPAGVDDVLLRRTQALVPGQHHGPAGLAELVEHVDHDDAGGLGVDVDLTLQSLRGEDVDGHGGLLRARFRPIIASAPHGVKRRTRARRRGAVRVSVGPPCGKRGPR